MSDDAAADPSKPSVAEPQQINAARDLLKTLMSTQEAYHNHKEQMAYVLGALYLAAASWIINSPHPEWVRGLFFEVFFIVVVVVVALYGYYIIKWQLDRRRQAATIVTALYRLSSQWLTKEPSVKDLQRRAEKCRYGFWPRSLAEEIESEESKMDVSLGKADRISRVILSLAGLSAVARAMYASEEVRCWIYSLADHVR